MGAIIKVLVRASRFHIWLSSCTITLLVTISVGVLLYLQLTLRAPKNCRKSRKRTSKFENFGFFNFKVHLYCLTRLCPYENVIKCLFLFKSFIRI